MIVISFVISLAAGDFQFEKISIFYFAVIYGIYYIAECLQKIYNILENK